MTKANTPQQQTERVEGKATKPEDKLPTYQELLDEALEETFPASDPIAPGAGSHPAKQVRTDKDDRDWKLQPEQKPQQKSDTPDAQRRR